MAANTIREPPSYDGIKGDRAKLTHYISALKTWARVSGVDKKNQAAPDLLTELTLIEDKYGVWQHYGMVRKSRDSYKEPGHRDK